MIIKTREIKSVSIKEDIVQAKMEKKGLTVVSLSNEVVAYCFTNFWIISLLEVSTNSRSTTSSW